MTSCDGVMGGGSMWRGTPAPRKTEGVEARVEGPRLGTSSERAASPSWRCSLRRRAGWVSLQTRGGECVAGASLETRQGERASAPEEATWNASCTTERTSSMLLT
eukprot:scaffold4504_cov116-Isochrysis_galbana.AAC.4